MGPWKRKCCIKDIFVVWLPSHNKLQKRKLQNNEGTVKGSKTKGWLFFKNIKKGSSWFQKDATVCQVHHADVLPFCWREEGGRLLVFFVHFHICCNCLGVREGELEDEEEEGGGADHPDHANLLMKQVMCLHLQETIWNQTKVGCLGERGICCMRVTPVLKALPRLEQNTFEVWIDHEKLEVLKTLWKLSTKQVQWAQYFSHFNFMLHYLPGGKNFLADALSCMPQYNCPKAKIVKPVFPSHQLASQVTIRV